MNDVPSAVTAGFMVADCPRASRGAEVNVRGDAERAAFDVTLALASESIVADQDEDASGTSELESDTEHSELSERLVAPPDPTALFPLPVTLRGLDLAAPAGAGSSPRSQEDPGHELASAGKGSGADAVEDFVKGRGPVQLAHPAGIHAAASTVIETAAANMAKDAVTAETPAPADEKPLTASAPVVAARNAARPPAAMPAPVTDDAAHSGAEASRQEAAAHAGVRAGSDGASSPHTHAPLRPRTPGAAAAEAKLAAKRAAPAERAESTPVDPASSSVVDPSAGTPAVGVPTESVKTVAAVTVPAATDTAARSPDRDLEGGVRAAEAAGHRRALGSEAHGRISVPELGAVEVRAIADAARVDVHVHAEEDHARHVILAHAPELSAHVKLEVPEARIHLDGQFSQGELATAARGSTDLASNDGSGRRESPRETADREATTARSNARPVVDASDGRRRARVRIVL